MQDSSQGLGWGGRQPSALLLPPPPLHGATPVAHRDTGRTSLQGSEPSAERPLARESLSFPICKITPVCIFLALLGT